jgi:hypothetical protein
VGPSAAGRHLALTVSSLDYAAVHEVWVLDRETGEAVHHGATGVLGRSATLPASLGDGPARARHGRLSIDVDEIDGGTRLRATIPGASFDVVAAKPPGHECLAVVVPWSDRRFQYTVKDVARPASGTVTMAGVTSAVPAGESWAVLDHGRGRCPSTGSWAGPRTSTTAGDHHGLRRAQQKKGPSMRSPSCGCGGG